MTPQDVGNLAIIGTILSLLVSFIKHYAGTSGTKAKWLTIGIAAVGGTIYFFLKDTSYWQTILIIIGYINFFYLVIGQYLDGAIQKVVSPNQ